MKLQHLAIIFVIIILPISMVIASYMQTQIDTVSLQTTYNTILQNATYDAIKSFQLNTINSKYSTVSDSKIRDIEASISTFYSSLGTGMGASGYDTDTLKEYIPAMLYTMYDGYYIYGEYYNEENNDYQYGLKPYIYYSCRYVSGTNYDFVVNYTLDNSITIYGKVYESDKGYSSYVTKSGYLINPNLVSNIQTDSNGNLTSLIYDNVTIEREILAEQLVIINDDNTVSRDTYQYVWNNNKKVYKDGNGYFWNNSNKKQYITDNETLTYVHQRTINNNLYSDSGLQYYYNSYEFSKWINSNLSRITQEDAVDSDGNAINDFATKTGSGKIFSVDDKNNPLISGSIFNENRISVIRRTIQTNLTSAIANYSSSAGTYEFAMPIFTEDDWYKIVNNISLTAFMQGIPIGSKYFNNYSIITNDKNKEVTTEDSLYVITEDGEAHLAGCKDVIDNNKKVVAIYKNTDFERQTVVVLDTQYNYYPHDNSKCYNCIVNISQTYDIDNIIDGKIMVYDKNTDTYSEKKDIDISNLRKLYLTALGRERYDLYRTNYYFGL